MKRLCCAVCILAICCLAAADLSWASRPVPRTITGCVIEGILHSSDGYEIRTRDLSLEPYEGKRIQVRGSLLPGDILYVEPGSVKVLGKCGGKSRKPEY